MRSVDGESYYYMYNGHADVTALINAATGTVDATYYYDAFGNITESIGNVNNNITYAGYQWDEETGLYYLNARMYDPKITRFLQEDTYLGDPNDPLSLNLYTYAANNPIIYYDPTGHKYVRKEVAPGYYDRVWVEDSWGDKIINFAFNEWSKYNQFKQELRETNPKLAGALVPYALKTLRM